MRANSAMPSNVRGTRQWPLDPSAGPAQTSGASTMNSLRPGADHSAAGPREFGARKLLSRFVLRG
jgi:hypothetical protein